MGCRRGGCKFTAARTYLPQCNLKRKRVCTERSPSLVHNTGLSDRFIPIGDLGPRMSYDSLAARLGIDLRNAMPSRRL